MRSALTAHDEVLRSAIEAHGGWLFKHTGDGACAAFGSARAAVDSAVEAQRRLGLPVRMGVASGEAELRDEDYFGPVVEPHGEGDGRRPRRPGVGRGGHRRVALGCGAGWIWVSTGSETSRASSTSSRCAPRGWVRCSRRCGPWTPCRGTCRCRRRASWAGARRSRRSSSWCGPSRLVTLTGVGGVGKTRLALQAAAQLTGEFSDGVWLVELAPVGDPAAVPDVVATTLGVTPRPGMSRERERGAGPRRPADAGPAGQLRTRPGRGGGTGRDDPRSGGDGHGAGHQPGRAAGRAPSSCGRCRRSMSPPVPRRRRWSCSSNGPERSSRGSGCAATPTRRR